MMEQKYSLHSRREEEKKLMRLFFSDESTWKKPETMEALRKIDLSLLEDEEFMISMLSVQRPWNPSPPKRRIPIMEKNIDKIDWSLLANTNPNPIEIDWSLLANTNPNPIEIEIKPFPEPWHYPYMKKKMKPLAEEIAAYVFNPSRMDRIAKRNNIPFDVLINEIY